jgi:hypothetical protein
MLGNETSSEENQPFSRQSSKPVHGQISPTQQILGTDEEQQHPF